MWSRWSGFDRLGYNDLERTFAALDDFRRQFDRAVNDLDAGRAQDVLTGDAPFVNVYDNGRSFLVTVDVPGFKASDLSLTLHDNVLTLKGERRREVPEGYQPHRQERGAYKFTRSFRFPVKVDGDKVQATTRDGVLEVSVEKAAESQPRQINVNVA